MSNTIENSQRIINLKAKLYFKFKIQINNILQSHKNITKAL